MKILPALPFMAMSLFGIFIAFLGIWESIAIVTDKVTTISSITAQKFADVGLGYKVVILLGAGILIGALLVHFTGWKALPGTTV